MLPTPESGLKLPVRTFSSFLIALFCLCQCLMLQSQLPFCCFVFGYVSSNICFLIPCWFSTVVIKQTAVTQCQSAGQVEGADCLSLGCQRMYTALGGCSGPINPITCMKTLSETQCSLLVSVPDQVSTRTENFTSSCPVLFAPGQILGSAHNVPCMYSVPSHAVKLKCICLVCCQYFQTFSAFPSKFIVIF